jgi:hypothetical protein
MPCFEHVTLPITSPEINRISRMAFLGINLQIYRIRRILTVVYSTQNYWVPGLCPSSAILKHLTFLMMDKFQKPNNSELKFIFLHNIMSRIFPSRRSWLQNGDVLCFLWGTNWIDIYYVEESRPPLWSSGQSSWLQMQRSGFVSRRYQIFWEAVGLERGPFSLVSTVKDQSSPKFKFHLTQRHRNNLYCYILPNFMVLIRTLTSN